MSVRKKLRYFKKISFIGNLVRAYRSVAFQPWWTSEMRKSIREKNLAKANNAKNVLLATGGGGNSVATKVESLINVNTKMIWIETPTNPMMNIIDIKAISNLAKKHNILSAVDNTFSSPYLQNPLDLGADVVVHSITKFIAGHSDVVMGAIVLNDEQLANKLYFIQNSCGAVPGPQDCFLVLRGIKTLHVRMDRHCENAIQVASFLENHSKVECVFYPGLRSHPNHQVAVEQMNNFGGMISFISKGNSLEDAKKVITSTKIFSLAESLGGVESLCGHPATMTHAAIPKEEREKSGVVDALIRLSVGIEDVEDLIADLSQALEKI